MISLPLNKPHIALKKFRKIKFSVNRFIGNSTSCHGRVTVVSRLYHGRITVAHVSLSEGLGQFIFQPISMYSEINILHYLFKSIFALENKLKSVTTLLWDVVYMIFNLSNLIGTLLCLSCKVRSKNAANNK